MKYVLGLGRTGVSVSKYLLKHQIPFIAWDDSELNCEKAALMGVDIVAPTKAPWHAISEIVCSPGIPLTYPKPHKAIELGKQYRVPVRGDVDYWAQTQQGRGVRFVGITGTNGKSTTHSMIAHVLTRIGVSHFSGGNNGTPVFDSDMLVDGITVNLELSSYQLDLIKNVEFEAGVLLNITPDHLDRHGSMSAYIAAKRSLLEAVAADGIKIVGVDTESSRVVYEDLKKQGVSNLVPISSSLLEEGVYVAQHQVYRAVGGEAKLLGKVPNRLLGDHQGQNLIAAMLVCEHLGVSTEDFLSAMQTYTGLEHRQETVLETDKAVFINDTKATNAEAVLPALTTFKNIYWIAGGVSKDEGVKPLISSLDNVKKAYLIGNAAEQFAKQLGPSGVDIALVETLQGAMEAIQKDVEAAPERVTVLLSPAAASFDQFLNFEKRGEAFKKLVSQKFKQGETLVF